MPFLKTIAVGIALAAAMPATAATIINFDQLPNGTTLPSTGTAISTQYASLGLTISGTNTQNNTSGPLNAWGLIAASGPGGSGNYLGNFGEITPSSPVPGPSDYLLAPRYNIMSLSFDGTASEISFGLYTGGGQNSVSIIAYDAMGGQLQSLSNVMANNGQFDIQTLTASGIAQIDIVGGFNNPPNGSVRLFGIDNLTFTLDAVTPAVPEPASWALMIAGFGMTGASLRRRKIRTSVSFA
ncbi:PEPxxWA-CTERM sorting domain-containing protein [Sphingomonas sp. 1P06PA]|uniref:PEPxxWA-CTERM sorting domain-containing protein n=1 Tax=Sphingomonas sp. 1P06PA TaxID=554121 RepID=UPI0039A58D2E